LQSRERQTNARWHEFLTNKKTMQRLETSVTQANAALDYLLDKGANISGHVLEINHYGLKKINLEKRPIQPQKTAKEHFQQAMKRLLGRQ